MDSDVVIAKSVAAIRKQIRERDRVLNHPVHQKQGAAALDFNPQVAGLGDCLEFFQQAFGRIWTSIFFSCRVKKKNEIILLNKS